MIRETVNAFMACVVTFALCAVAYPAAVYGLGQTLFPRQARGGLIERDGKVIGSALIAQPFASAKYFSPRPSAAGPVGYSADAAGGSNLGTTNPALHDRIALDASRRVAARTGDPVLVAALDRLDAAGAALKARGEVKEPSAAEAGAGAVSGLAEEVAASTARALERSRELGRTAGDLVPVDLVTASGSGLDPDISPEAALYQAAGVASARKMPLDRVLELIDGRVNRSGAIIGAPARVNVLLLNLDLDREAVPPPAAPAQ